MQSKIILVSDDSNFFEYITPKLKLRNSDELFKFKFSELPDKLHLMKSSMLIINSEQNKAKTLELIDLANNVPAIVFGYNEDDSFKIEAYKRGMYSYILISTPDEEIEAKLLSALRLISSMEKINIYRDVLVKNNLITRNNEVFLDFTNILDNEVNNIVKNSAVATLLAISPDEQNMHNLQPNMIETIILNNIRKNDILMSYSHNKYFLLLNNANLDKAKKIWKSISAKLPSGLFAGYSSVEKKTRQQIINEALNNLHKAISADSQILNTVNMHSGQNFKFFRQEFNKKIEQVVSPVFYLVQQTFNNEAVNMKIEQGFGDGYCVLYIKSEQCIAGFRVTSPGFSTINIDITYEKTTNDNEINHKLEPKRITIEPNDFEAGILQDLLDEFIKEFVEAIGSNEERGT